MRQAILTVLLVCAGTCPTTSSQQPNSLQEETHGLQRTMRSFTEAWMVRGNLEEAAAYLSAQAIESTDLVEVIERKGESVNPEGARKVFAEILAMWRGETGELRSLGDAMASLPTEDIEIEDLNRDAPESKWYNIFVVDEDLIGALAASEEDQKWLTSELQQGALCAQTFKLHNATGEDMGPLTLVWRSEARGWRIIFIGGFAM